MLLPTNLNVTAASRLSRKTFRWYVKRSFHANTAKEVSRGVFKVWDGANRGRPWGGDSWGRSSRPRKSAPLKLRGGLEGLGRSWSRGVLRVWDWAGRGGSWGSGTELVAGGLEGVGRSWSWGSGTELVAGGLEGMGLSWSLGFLEVWDGAGGLGFFFFRLEFQLLR